LQEHKADLEVRDFFKEPFTEDELTRLIGSNTLAEFLSTRARSFKERRWDKKLPTKKEAVAAIIADPTLLRRPILVANGRIVVGFSQTAYENLIATR
jgi:arsenate reductase-like glutaredoxin family protein